MSNANFGYKGMKKLTTPSRFNQMQHSKTGEIDQVFNVIIENNPKDIVELAHTIGAYSPKTAKLFDFLKNKVKIKISYLKSDLEELKNLTKNALGFFIPSRNELYTRLDSKTSLALQERGKELGVGVFDSFKITLVHEAIHAYFNNLAISDQNSCEYNLKNLARRILDAKIKTNVKYFEHYTRILRDVVAGSQSPQEVVTYWFSADDLKEPLQQFNDDIMTVLDSNIDNNFDIIEPFIPNKEKKTKLDTMDNIFTTEIQTADSIGDYDLLTGDAFFKQNPSKVLGKVIPRTNQFGELVDAVQGNIETEIHKIEAPIPEQIQYNDIQTGNSSDIAIEVKIEESIKNIENVILSPKKQKKEKGLQGDFVNEIISFRESTELYNKDLTRIEIEAYLSVHPEIKYSLYFDDNKYSNTNFINNRIEFLVTSGDGYTRNVKTPLVIPVNDKFEYYAEFLSGDVVSKKKIIDLSKDEIIEKYSEAYYNDIQKALEMVMPKVKRFNDAVVSNRPVLLCHTKDARNHKITALKNGYEFKESVSLVTGFAYWLRNYYSALEYNGVTFLDIEKYIDNENWYDAPKDSKPDEKKAIDAKNSEAYQRAKIAGDAAFSFFLAEMVLEKELDVIERQWNERFNRYVYPNLNKIPVGFTHSAKFKDGHNLAFSDVQRNAVAFMKLNGSGLIAYGVGIGKTLSAIISISNAIDNGGCIRPLIVVPNPTYYKWISEITNTKVYDKDTKVEINHYGAISHLGNVNELYNLNTDLIKNSLREYSDNDNQKFQSLTNSIIALDEILNKYIDKKGNTKTINLEKIKKNDPILGESVKEAIADIDEVVHDEVALMVFESEESKNTGNRTAVAKFAEFMDAKETNRQLKWVNAKVELINQLLKFSKKYYEYLVFTSGTLKQLPEKTVTICTYEGFARFGFSEETSQMIFDELVDILTQGQDLTNKKGELDPKKYGKWQQKIKKIIGQSKESARVDFDEFGFDYIVIDEAHNCKKIFTSVVNEKSDDENKARYKLQSGEASTRGLKAFCITHYVQSKNKGRNVCLLTATPFTNSPLEIYSMLSLTNHKVIEDYGFRGLKEFFDYFIRTEYGFVVNAKNQPVKKEEVVGFVNLQSLRNLIYSVIDYKTGEEANVLRPCKITLPIKDTSVICKESAQELELPMIETIVKPTEQQMKYFLAIENYMLGEDQNEAGLDFGNAEVVADGDVAEDETVISDGTDEAETQSTEDAIVVKKSNSGNQYIDKIEGNIVYLKDSSYPVLQNEIKRKNTRFGRTKDFNYVKQTAENQSDKKIFVWFDGEYYSAWQIIKESVAVENVNIGEDKEPEFVRIMKGLSFMRTVSLSPYLFKKANLGIPTAAEVVETSPKIKYVMDCIKHIKDYQAQNNQPMKGIIIYCNLGTNKSSFGFSLIELLAEYLTDNKIGVGFRNDEVKLIYSKITKPQREVIKKDFNDGRVKVIIGSATIKEGIDLQKDTIGMFNLTVDWNPTDATQIEGRCHRQGNKNAYVFINYVLLADSADVVYFQKLQDKTSRIKEIWDRENIKSDMDLKEFDPNQIKADLMTRADKIAVIEQDKDISVVKRENDIIMAKVEEMNKASERLNDYSSSKQPVIDALTQLELAIVEYRRAVRIEGRDAKIKELKEQFTEIEFNEDLSDEDKEKERKKIKSELSKVQGEGFVSETNEMFKVENDYSTFTDEQLADKLKKEQEKFRYGGTYYKYMEFRYNGGSTEIVKKAAENIGSLYSFFNPEKMQSLAFKFLWSWKAAEYYQDKYLRSLGMGLEQLTDYRDSLIAESLKLEEKIAEIKDKLPERIEAIKDRIRRKTDRYKDIAGRVKEFESLSHLFNIPSGYGVAVKNDIKPIEHSVSATELQDLPLSKDEIVEIIQTLEMGLEFSDDIESIKEQIEVLQMGLEFL